MEVQTLWEAYWQDPSVENKNRLLLHYVGLVRSAVKRMMPIYRGRMDYDDLLSSGILGLMDAIERYDGRKGVKFESYAIKRVRGEILDYMRKQDWISSSIRIRINRTRAARDTLSAQLGRPATDAEIAEHMGCDEKQVAKTWEDEYYYNIIYFERMAAEDDEFSLMDTIADDDEEGSPELSMDKSEMLGMLAGALDKLPQKERQVIEMYYKDELLLREIADILGVTESRVSQIHARALARLKGSMEKGMML